MRDRLLCGFFVFWVCFLVFFAVEIERVHRYDFAVKSSSSVRLRLNSKSAKHREGNDLGRQLNAPSHLPKETPKPLNKSILIDKSEVEKEIKESVTKRLPKVKKKIKVAPPTQKVKRQKNVTRAKQKKIDLPSKNRKVGKSNSKKKTPRDIEAFDLDSLLQDSSRGDGLDGSRSDSGSGLETGVTYNVEENPRPKYPLISRKLGEEGVVIVEVSVGHDGSITNISVKKSSGYTRLDRSTIFAVRNWNFGPAINILGRPKNSVVELSFTFMMRENDIEVASDGANR